jgi:hypothetical protein
MSVSCQQETHAPQQTTSLFDHLAGAGNVKPHLTLLAKKGIHQR